MPRRGIAGSECMHMSTLTVLPNTSAESLYKSGSYPQCMKILEASHLHQYLGFQSILL